MKFTKMNGLGNDYIYINCFDEKLNIEEMKEEIIRMSDRHFGIGGDGVIFICPSSVADARMRMFNADGSEGQMCGNGIRCVGKYVYDNNICKKNPLRIETQAGIKELKLTINEHDLADFCEVNMGTPIIEPKNIPVDINKESVINERITIDNQDYYITCVSMGNPHCIVFAKNIDSLDLEKIGPKFENHPLFPERINTEFIEVISPNELKMRVWERGSGETLACGTGASASVVASYLNNLVPQDEEILIHLLGGDLRITYTSSNEVIMKGPATTVFEGQILTLKK